MTTGYYPPAYMALQDDDRYATIVIVRCLLSGYSFSDITAKKGVSAEKLIELGKKTGFFDSSGLTEKGKLFAKENKFQPFAEEAEQDDDEERPRPKGVSSLAINGKIYEQVWDGGKCQFAVWDGDHVDYVATAVDQEVGTVYVPIEGDELVYGAVSLPERAEEYSSLEELIREIRSHVHKWLDVPEFYEEIAVYFILASWLFDKLYAVPYLRALGDTGTGKSRFLDTVGRLCYKPITISGCITPAPIYRMIAKWGGTLIIDESDFRDSTEQSEIVKILNCGIEKGRPIIRCDPNDPASLNVFPDFCPKILASRKTFQDKALESRCLTVTMKETDRTIPDQLTKDFWEEQKNLRGKLLMFRFRNLDRTDAESVQEIKIDGVEPRLRQVARSLLVPMQGCRDVQDRFLLYIREYNREIVGERSASFEGMVVEAMWSLKEEGEVDMSPQAVAEKMTEIHKLKDTPTAQKVGRCLKSLGITTQKRRIGRSTRHIIVWDDRIMAKLKTRYIADCEAASDNNGTNDTNGTGVPSVPIVPSYIRARGENIDPVQRLHALKAKGIRILSRGNPHGFFEFELEDLHKKGLLNAINPNEWEIL